MFIVDETSLLLDANEAELFHSMTARLLFGAKRTRPDIQVAVAYLCTRVQEPTIDNYERRTRAIKYLRTTVHLLLVIGSDESSILLWSINTSFAVRNNMRNHTGTMLTFGK